MALLGVKGDSSTTFLQLKYLTYRERAEGGAARIKINKTKNNLKKLSNGVKNNQKSLIRK